MIGLYLMQSIELAYIFKQIGVAFMANLQGHNILDYCKDPPYDGENLTNRVLIKHEIPSSGSSLKKSIVYYCPVYLRIKLKNFSEMSLSDLSATINQVIIMTVNLKNIPSIIQEQIKNRIVLRFNRDEPISLGAKSEEISSKIDEDGVISFTIRKLLHAGMKAQIFLSPFEMINLILTIKLQKVHINKEDIAKMIKQSKEKQEKLRDSDEEEKKEKTMLQEQIEYLQNLKHIGAYFNLMDEGKNKFTKISYSEEGTFGNYDLAEQKLDVEYSNKELSGLIRKDNEDLNQLEKNLDFSQIQEYQHAHFTIPLYKFPFVTLFTIFIPLWLLGIINLGIFFQDTGLGDRIGSLAALMIAFVALIPVIREALPPNPNITLVQILVYFETLTTLFCFIESLIVRYDETYVFSPFNNGFFLVSIIIDVVEVVIIAVLMIVHKCYWEKTYNRHVDDIGDISFNLREWKNKECDEHFRRKFDNREVAVLRVLKDLIDEEKKKEEERKKIQQKKPEKKKDEEKKKQEEKKKDKK